MPNNTLPFFPPRDRVNEMKAMAAGFTHDLPLQARKPGERRQGELKTVILTGSTGSIGSYLLDCMIRNATITKIYCLNRASTSPTPERQRTSMRNKGLNTSFPGAKVVFLDVNLTELYFGLPPQTYLELLENVTHIMHQAWQVNWALPMEHFEPAIKGVRQLVDFCVQSAYNATLIFVSTIGALMGWTDYHPNPVPEILMTDWRTAGETGYAEAKFVSEQILARACTVSSLKVRICRIGQVAGPTTSKGCWNMSEWFPSLIQTAIYLGAIPKDLSALETVDWIPVDKLAESMNEAYFTGDISATTNRHISSNDEISDDKIKSDNCQVLHFINPRKTTYATLLPLILRYLPTNVRQIEYDDWVTLMEQSRQVRQNPARRLLGMYKDMIRKHQAGVEVVQLGTSLSTQKSEILRNLGPVNNQWMSNWMQQWSFKDNSVVSARL